MSELCVAIVGGIVYGPFSDCDEADEWYTQQTGDVSREAFYVTVYPPTIPLTVPKDEDNVVEVHTISLMKEEARESGSSDAAQ